MFLTHERFRALLKSFGRPFGVPADGPLGAVVKSSMGATRMPRAVTLILLVASAAILLHPEVRMNLGAMLSLGLDVEWNSSKWHSVHKLQREGARTGDPKLFAILSLLPRRNGGELKESMARQAIAKDPSLTWLDYQYFAPEEIERLRRWDPNNAAVRLIPAESLFEKIRATSRDTGGFVHPKGALTALEKDAAANPEWLAAMNYALSAPKYDTYTSQQFQLLRDFTQKYQVMDPNIGLRLLYAQRQPNFQNLITYTHVVLHRAAEAESKGDTVAAIAGASQILRFAENMQLHSRYSIEEVIAAGLAGQACESLQPMMEKAGRHDEAQLVGFELAQSNAVSERVKSRSLAAVESQRTTLVWTALTIRIAAFAIVVLGVACLAGLVFLSMKNRVALESSGWLTISSLAVEFAPVLLLFATATLFLSYHPYAQAYRSYIERTKGMPSVEGMENFLAAGMVIHVIPGTIRQTVELLHSEYLLWLSTTVFLSMLAVFFLYRLLPRQRRVSNL